MSNLVAHACWLAEEFGFPVFPVRVEPDPEHSGKMLKKPLIKGWQSDAAVTNLETIEELFAAHPQATHAGIQTGDRSRLVVIDLDGEPGIKWWAAHTDLLPATRTQRTQRPGGKHLYYRTPKDCGLRNSAGQIAEGVDVRANGGFVVDWSADFPPPIDDIAEAPAELIDLLQKSSAKAFKGNGHDHDGTFVTGMARAGKQGSGARNVTLTKLAGSIRKAGFSAEAIAEALHKENYQRFDPPLPAAEVNRIVDQAEKWAQGGTEATVPSTPIDWDRLDGDPPSRTWWIQDWLGPSPTLCSGAGGVGKTKLLQVVGTSLATGREYLGPVAQPLTVLIWSCEDDQAEAWRTQVAINQHLRVSMADLTGRLYIVPRLGNDNTLLEVSYGKPQFTPLFDELRQQVNDLKVDVLGLDNLGQLFGGNENDRHQATLFVNGIAGLVRDRPFAPILLGHVARSQGSEYSGSAAWENAVRMRWYLGSTLPDQKLEEGEAVDPDVVYLARRKANYSTKDWRRLRFHNGLLVPDEPEGRRIDQGYRDDAAERVVLEAVPKLVGIGVQPTDSRNSGDYLPTQIVDKGYAQGYGKRDLKAAMHRLMGASKLKRDVVGQYSNRNKRYGLVIP